MTRFFILLLALPLVARSQTITATNLNAGNTFIGTLQYLQTDWSQRVVNNGGVQPSWTASQAMETLRLGCIAAGLTNKIYSLCVAIDGNIIATSTPLFKHFGSDPWTNNGFVDADVNINGCKGDGVSKSFDTGIKPKVVQVPASGSTIGLTVIVTESASNEDKTAIGYQDSDGSPLVAINTSAVGVTRWFPTESGGSTRISTNDWGRVGYLSGNRTLEGGPTNVTLYVASPLESHKLLDSLSGDIAAVATSEESTISVFAIKSGASVTRFASLRMSLEMVHDGFTATESSNFWVLAKACRETLGGGTGDPVHDWNRKVVAAGGANVSSTTSNFSRAFWSGLDTDAALYSIVVANAFPPDNLTACRVPLIWQAGSEVWTNVNFGASNLTVNGLDGDGTSKYLGTGVTANTVVTRGFGTTSAGASVLIYSPDPLVGGANFGVGGASSYQFIVGKLADAAYFSCWKSINVNTDFVRLTLPGTTNFAGYISGNRTAANAIRLDWVTNGVHNIATNGTGNQTGAKGTFSTLVFAANSSGTPALYDGDTVSFLAVHNGLTQTQSSNVWERVKALRTGFGGGVP